MAAGDLLTGPYQIELRSKLFDSINCSNGLVVAEFLDGFGVPETRNDDTPVQADHGVVPSRQYLKGRKMTCGIAAVGSTAAAVEQYLADIAYAWQPVSSAEALTSLVVPLVYTQSTLAQKWLVYGKPMRAPAKYDRLLRTFRSPAPFTDAVLCEFLATDPAIYSATLKSANATPGASSGGHSFPLGFPHGFGTATPGSASCVNSGNFRTWPTLTFTAGGSGLVTPQASILETGEIFKVVITLAAADTLVVDMAAKTVLLNGAASRIDNVDWNVSDWFDFDASSTSTVQFTGTGAGSTMGVTWRDAWLR